MHQPPGFHATSVVVIQPHPKYFSKKQVSAHLAIWRGVSETPTLAMVKGEVALFPCKFASLRTTCVANCSNAYPEKVKNMREKNIQCLAKCQ